MIRTRTWVPYALVLPALIYLAVFFVYPLVEAFVLSFRAEDGGLTLAFFRQMASDTYFRGAIRNSFLLTALVVPLQLAIALVIALIVNTRFRLAPSFLYICAIPLGISDLAAGLIWLSVFTERGYLNTILGALGRTAQPITFLTPERMDWLYGAIVATEVWRATAIVMVILVAGLQLVPRDYLEAADVFGARPLQKLWRITLPLLMPSLQAALMIRTILALQLFATVITLSGRLVPVLAGESYFWYSIYRNFNVASAYAVLIMAISFLITFMYLRLLRTKAEALA
ncbi:MAG: carbohydrate ABC transporter permease [bacterium]